MVWVFFFFKAAGGGRTSLNVQALKNTAKNVCLCSWCSILGVYVYFLCVFFMLCFFCNLFFARRRLSWRGRKQGMAVRLHGARPGRGLEPRWRYRRAVEHVDSRARGRGRELR